MSELEEGVDPGVLWREVKVSGGEIQERLLAPCPLLTIS